MEIAEQFVAVSHRIFIWVLLIADFNYRSIAHLLQYQNCIWKSIGSVGVSQTKKTIKGYCLNKKTSFQEVGGEKQFPLNLTHNRNFPIFDMIVKSRKKSTCAIRLISGYLVSERKLGFFVQIKEGENFNRRNTLSISRIKIWVWRRYGRKRQFSFRH